MDYKEISEDRIQLTTYILWWLWKSRNLCVFENKRMPAKRIIDNAVQDWRDFQEIQYQYSTYRISNDFKDKKVGTLNGYHIEYDIDVIWDDEAISFALEISIRVCTLLVSGNRSKKRCEWSSVGVDRKSKIQAFSFVLEAIKGRINSWRSKLLSPAGKEVMIKAALSSLYLFAKKWQGYVLTTGGVKMVALPKDQGGLGFQDIRLCNEAIIMKKLWKLATQPKLLKWWILAMELMDGDQAQWQKHNYTGIPLGPYKLQRIKFKPGVQSSCNLVKDLVVVLN
ncbi:ribonuclease H-like superfamily protein [Striga asiatica]|uniref:Ribonuclease H-like superfamily protein n=1 Tax=Striga asiatica TaxID=4170 RepID=A0A5A7Q283_STRAF|nr:ribonuclease H-like superfamily protein [Striga asiatica]